MPRIVTVLGVVASLGLLGACSTFTDQDRAKLNQASEDAAAAKTSADAANKTAQDALAAAQRAQAAADQANEKADRMFSKSLRK
jgi:outer membrane murein-binding lipoprotein Lpp